MAISVLHIAHYAATYSGNFIASLEELEKQISEEKGNVIYMFPEWAKENGAQTWIAEMKNAGKKIYYFSGNIWKDFVLLRKLISIYGVNIIHTHFLPAKYQLSVKFACTKKKILKVVHFHNHSEDKKGMESFFRKWFYSNSVMIACGESVYKSICRDYPSNKRYKVDNGITSARLETFEILTPQELGIKNDAPICLMFGFDFERKGVDLACLAVRKLWKEGKRVNLLISVSSNYEYVKKRIKEIMGDIPEWVVLMPSRSDVASLYNSVNVFISPSREEGLPYSALEASFSSCTVVLSNIEAQKLDIPYTYWFECENIESLSQAIVIALENQKEKRKHIKEAKLEVMSKYSVSSWAKGIMEVYNRELRQVRKHE